MLENSSWILCVISVIRDNSQIWMIGLDMSFPEIILYLDEFSSKRVWLMTRFWKNWIGTRKVLMDEFFQ